MFSKTKYFFLSLLVLISFSSSTYAEGDTYCTGRVTGVTNLQNPNAGQNSFNSHLGPGTEDNEVVDLSIIGQAGGLAPANREHAACVNDETGTYESDAYEYGLHGFSWNDNLGFISFGCQGGKNRAGEGLGVDCGNIDYGVYIDAANELFGNAWSSAFGWMQFRGQGTVVPEPAISDVYQIDAGESLLVIFEGQEYEFYLSQTQPYGGGEFTVNGAGPFWSGNDPYEDVYNDQILYEDIFINYVSASYDEALGVNFWWRFTLEERVPPAGAVGPVNADVGEPVKTTVTVDGLSTQYRVELLTNTPPGASQVMVSNHSDGVDLGTQWINEGATADFDEISLLVWESNYSEGPTPHLVYYLIPPGGAYAEEACPEGLCGGGEPFDYGVTMDVDGYLHGYAWTEAGIWVDFEGARIELPDLEVVDNGDGATWCEGEFYICVEVRPNPMTLDFDAGGEQEIRIADGTDGYYIHLFLMDGTGDNAMPLTDAAVVDFLNSIQINWQDTVKINQTNGAAGDVGDTLSIVKQPWANAQGAVTYKPLTFADFDPVPGEPGQYISRFKTTSHAPTDDANLSWTTSTEPAYLSNNTEERGEVEPNQLILERVTYDALNAGALQLPAGAAYPNGKVNLNLSFRPAIEVNTLYSGVLRDTLVGYRAVPENVAIGVRSIGALPAYALNSARIIFTLDYSQSETQAQPNCVGANFNFHFMENFTGAPISAGSLTGIFNNLNNTLKDIPVIATLPEVESEELLPCNYAESPTLYTKVRYKSSSTSPIVYYYHNNLPRIAGSGVFNPEITVHGNVVGQKVTGVTSVNNMQSSGSGVVSAVRDTINKNIKQKIGDFELSSDQECVISMLNTINDYDAGDCTVNEDYKVLQIGNENVLYFTGNDVVLDLDGGFENPWVIINDGGDIFVHGDAYNADPDDERLSLLAFKNEDFEHGNVYLGPCSDSDKMVKNLQATIVADGGLFSYTGKKDEIDDDGRPGWPSATARVDALGCQILTQGTIFSRNTIGGADADGGDDPRQFILLGGGEVIELPVNLDDRMKAQNDDLNYLRLFRLQLEISPEGLPIDQRCGMGLSPADILAIDQSQLWNGPAVCGEPLSDGSQPCDPATASFNSNNVCDGINPFEAWAGGNAFLSGDLVPPQNDELLAEGLNNDPLTGSDFDPVYVFYVAPDRDSFVFSEAGGF